MINEECSADGRSGDDGKVPHLPLSRKPRPFLCGKLLIGCRGRSSWMEPLCPTVVSAFTSRRRPLGHLQLDSAHGCKHGGEVQPAGLSPGRTSRCWVCIPSYLRDRNRCWPGGRCWRTSEQTAPPPSFSSRLFLIGGWRVASQFSVRLGGGARGGAS